MKNEPSAHPPQAPASGQGPYTRAAEALIVSEVRYRRLFEAARDGILILDADTGEIIDVNPFLIELLGMSRDQFLGKEIWEIGHFKDVFANKEKFLELQKVGYVRYDDLPLQTVEGRKVPVEFVSNVYLEGQHRVIQCNIRDNTNRNQALDQARDKEHLLSESQKLGRVGSWYMDMRGRLQWSEETYRIYGVSRDTFTPTAETLAGLLHPDDRQAMRSWIAACAAGEAPVEQEFRVIRPDGTTRIVLGRGELARDAENKPLHMAGTVQDITERKLAERALQEAELKYRTLIEKMPAIIYTAGLQSGSPTTFISSQVEQVLGVSPAEYVKNPDTWRRHVHPEDIERVLAAVARAHETGLPFVSEYRMIGRGGQEVWVKDEAIVAKDTLGVPQYLLGVMSDITKHKSAEKEREKIRSQLLQAQKMESVGRLAGGVAHDFNNLLTAINGYAEFVLEGLAKDDPKREDVLEILAAGQRAAGLTRQLLAFSRKQILNPEVLDIHAAVGATGKMLRRLIGEDIKLETKLAAHPCLVKVDAGQLEQVLLNLAVNARDAMPKGGTLTFETGIVNADADFLSRHPDLPRGPLVCLSVRDTGCGMSDEVRARLFEPFFTTKGKGKGTGLGLAMVFGIIKQSGGDVEVESVLGRGTTFRIYLPQIGPLAQDKAKDKVEGKGVVLRGDETILFVEDEETVRRFGKRTLVGSGYTVLTAVSGPEALEVLERHGQPVDLLITDVVMPGMSGRDLALEIVRRDMARRTLYISGYTDDAIVRHGVLEPGLAFLFKPFSAGALLSKLREVLDGPADRAKA